MAKKNYQPRVVVKILGPLGCSRHNPDMAPESSGTKAEFIINFSSGPGLRQLPHRRPSARAEVVSTGHRSEHFGVASGDLVNALQRPLAHAA